MRYSKIWVNSWCVAATVREHGSAGLVPQNVVKTYDPIVQPSDFSPGLPARTARPICVSHCGNDSKWWEWRGGECAQSGAETTCFVHLGSDGKDVTSEAFEHVTNIERSKCTAGVGHKEDNGVTEVVRTLIERKADLWSRKTLAELAKKLIG